LLFNKTVTIFSF